MQLRALPGRSITQAMQEPASVSNIFALGAILAWTACSSRAAVKAFTPPKDPKGSKGPQFAQGLRGFMGQEMQSTTCTGTRSPCVPITGTKSPSVATSSHPVDACTSSTSLQPLVAESECVQLRALPGRSITQAIVSHVVSLVVKFISILFEFVLL